MTVNTKEKAMQAKTSNTKINNSISQRAQSVAIQYRVDITFRDGTTASENFAVSTSNRPRIPEDPEGNVSVSIGNKVFQEATIQVPLEAASVITDAVSKIPASAIGVSSKNTAGSRIPSRTISTTRGRGRY